MSLTQRQKVVPPVPSDSRLLDYSQGIQLNLSGLFEAAHVHPVQTSAPTASAGNPGDILIVNLSGSVFLYVKVTTSSWFKVALTAA